MITILLPAMDRSRPVRRVRQTGSFVREAKHNISQIYFKIEILNFYIGISFYLYVCCNEVVHHSERIRYDLWVRRTFV